MNSPPPAEDQRPAETTAATGDQWVIGHGEDRAVVTEIGATLRSFTLGDRQLIEGFASDEWSQGGRGQVLAPWPNRLGDGRYTFEGITAQAALDEPAAGNAIHGLVRWVPWRMVARAQNQVTMEYELRPSPGYPFALRLTVEYRIGRDGLTVTTGAENTGSGNLPFGIGFHPYLTLGVEWVDSWRLTVPASSRLISDERGLPVRKGPVAGSEFDFSRGRLVGVTRLDTAFCDLRHDADGRTRIELDLAEGGRGITLWADDRFKYVMVYSGDTLPPEERRTALAVEPMSCPPDAFRSGTDVAVIAPGATWTGTWGIMPR
jgi:aldose 1-epimerase